MAKTNEYTVELNNCRNIVSVANGPIKIARNHLNVFYGKNGTGKTTLCKAIKHIDALAHPARPTRPELRGAVTEIFSRTANGCGHRQVAMCLCGELGVAIADKTVLKMMREMGIRCGIRRETDRHRYSSYKGVVGKTFENVIGRDFSAAGPWQKLGTDVTEFKRPWGKAYFAPVYDFGSKEIVAWSTLTSLDIAQQLSLLDRLLERMPSGATPVLHSDMG